MSFFAELLTAINADVIASLAAGGYPALVDGAILFGPARQFEQSAPPRIIIVPKDSEFGAPDLYPSALTIYSSDRKKATVMKVQHSERLSFDVRCWGVANPPHPINDYDVTRALYHAVLASLQRLAPNHGLEKKGQWTKDGPLNHDGKEFVFSTWIDTPVLDTLLPYSASTMYAPSGTVPVTTDTFINSSGGTGTGC